MWIYLAALNLALNLAHYLFASVSTEKGRTVITLYPAVKGDQVKVDDPADVRRLFAAFDQHALAFPEPPPPAEAATDVVGGDPTAVFDPTAPPDISQEKSPGGETGQVLAQGHPQEREVTLELDRPAADKEEVDPQDKPAAEQQADSSPPEKLESAAEQPTELDRPPAKVKPAPAKPKSGGSPFVR